MKRRCPFKVCFSAGGLQPKHGPAKLALFVHVSDRAWEAARHFREQKREGAGGVALRLGCDKRGADLEAFVENTGGHCARAPGRPGRRGSDRDPSGGPAEWLSARLRSGSCPAIQRVPSAAAAPAMAPRRPARAGVAVACCWLLTGE